MQCNGVQHIFINLSNHDRGTGSTSHAVFIEPRGVARIMAATQGIHAIAEQLAHIARDLARASKQRTAYL